MFIFDPELFEPPSEVEPNFHFHKSDVLSVLIEQSVVHLDRKIFHSDLVFVNFLDVLSVDALKSSEHVDHYQDTQDISEHADASYLLLMEL